MYIKHLNIKASVFRVILLMHEILAKLDTMDVYFILGKISLSLSINSLTFISIDPYIPKVTALQNFPRFLKAILAMTLLGGHP